MGRPRHTCPKLLKIPWWERWILSLFLYTPGDLCVSENRIATAHVPKAVNDSLVRKIKIIVISIYSWWFMCEWMIDTIACPTAVPKSPVKMPRPRHTCPRLLKIPWWERWRLSLFLYTPADLCVSEWLILLRSPLLFQSPQWKWLDHGTRAQGC